MPLTSFHSIGQAIQALERDPSNSTGWMRLARRLLDAGHVEDAALAGKKASDLDARQSQVWQLRAEIAVRMSQIDQPIGFLERAVSLDPNNVHAYILLSQTRMMGGDLDGAEDALGHARRLAPRHLDAIATQTQLWIRRGAHQLAAELLEPVVDTGHPGIAYAWGTLQRNRDPASALAPVQRALTHARGFTRIHLLYLLGNLHDAMGHIDEAFSAFTDANNAKLAPFDPDAFDREVERRIAMWDKAACTPTDDAPHSNGIWVVGLPRSGTSLFEQMLGAHSRIHAGGELPLMPAIERHWEGAHRPLDAPTVAAYQRTMETRLRDGADNSTLFVTDKLPDNLMRLGLISRLAPGATVVSVHRDPIDTLWSCFRQNFGVGFAWTTRQPWLGRAYRAQQRLLAHYRDVVALKWVDVRYEDLVMDPGDVINRTLHRLGQSFEPDCVEPHRQKRMVNSASVIEVQQPIHTRSVGRASAYLHHLDPLLESL